MDTNPAYTVHEADIERDRDLILGLWRGNLGEDARMARKYDWFYRQCPLGAPLTLLLRHEESGEWVGVGSAGPRQMLMGGSRVLAGVLVDLAVLPVHRSLGPALILQTALMKAGAKRFELLYGFPNPKAAAVFKRVGYAPLGELTRYVRVLRHGDYARRRVPALLAGPAGWALDALDRLRLRARSVRLQGQWQARADATLGALWSLAGAGDGPVAVRDLAFLRWRFDQSPLVEVRYLVVRDADGGALAWFAGEARVHGLHVHDFWSRRGAVGPTRAELATLLRSARGAGHASVSVELGAAAATSAWGAAGFAAREARPVFGRSSGASQEAFAARLWLTSADEDE
ncbi:hypothetical protein [Luteimonas terricola]|uniref:GNAT family N-acetyltransferase n=1 Tax=Luteimonas terricola TaxID=645597 RepID=A0ABQ2EED0_9GAMM|nr:hypothetical protein [Luteimonas terricola]GGK08995.1 hypothetical protein GCM10011394_18050 [Luteimonas terricola]